MASQDSAVEVTEEEVVLEGSTRAAWEGSDVSRSEIEWLARTKRVPSGVECRLSGPEIQLDLKEGECVIFLAHFERGFGLPASDFMKSFLARFGLQPHHLTANAFTTVSAFVSFAEGYLGLWPTTTLWSK